MSIHLQKPSLKELYFSLFFILTISFNYLPLYGQYYLRGQLKDEQGNGLKDVRIALFSKGNYPFYTGIDGVFGLPSSLKIDTITFMKSGYDTLKTAVTTTQFSNFVLKAEQKKIDVSQYLLSHTNGFSYKTADKYDINDKDRSAYIDNVFVNTLNYPTTELGLHINKGGYNKVKRKLLNKEIPTNEEVKTEEILNFFNLKENDTLERTTNLYNGFELHYKISDCPWNNENKLLFINTIAPKINLRKTPPANIIFLLDASGSMDTYNKLPVLKSAFKLLTENLRPEDKVCIIAYGDVVTVLLPATPGSEKQTIIEAIEGLRPNGNTPGVSAIHMAYAKARENFIYGGNNRIIMATDGDFNVGNQGFKGLIEQAKRESKDGVYLSCLGLGIEKDENLEALAKAGQGHFAYLENEKYAEKILVEEFAQTMYTVAGNVFLKVAFNADQIASYRLIGFDNKRETIYNDVKTLLGGEAGSGQSLMAAFEITPKTTVNATIGKIELTYNLPNESNITKQLFPINYNYEPTDSLSHNYKIATCLVAYGEMLKKTEYTIGYSWNELTDLIKQHITPGNLLEKDLLELANHAKKLYPNRRK